MTALSIESLQKRVKVYGTAITVATFLLDFLPTFLVVHLLMRILPNVWVAWILAAIVALPVSITVNKANDSLLTRLLKNPKVARLMTHWTWIPDLPPVDSSQHPSLSRLMEDPAVQSLFTSESDLTTSVARNLLLKNNPEAHKEWLEWSGQNLRNIILMGFVISPYLMWPWATLSLLLLL